MKTLGTITKCRLVKRSEIQKIGITIVWETNLGEVTRTYNIPKTNTNQCDLFRLLSGKFQVKPPTGLIDKPMMLSLAIESKLRGTRCELTLMQSGNERYPYNIIEITPILTMNVSSIT
jgi:hypothetical protein